MRAWLMDGYSGVDALRLARVPDPAPGPGEAVVALRFAAINPADAFLAEAAYPARPALPHVLGRDGMGTVTEVHPDVKGLPPGTTVGLLRSEAGVTAWGTLAERVAAPAASLVRVPEGWRDEEMAGAPLVFLTAWQALTQWSDPPAPPVAGSVLLVTGASGGVGTATVQLAVDMGLRIVALSRHPEKRDRLRRLGAHVVFDPGTAALRREVAAAIAPARVDLVVDTVAGPLFSEVVAMLAPRGRVSVVGRSDGVVPAFNTASLFFRRIRIGGVAVSDDGIPAAAAAWDQIVRRMQASGRRPLVDRIFAFEEVKAAFARLREGPMGKVIVGPISGAWRTRAFFIAVQ